MCRRLREQGRSHTGCVSSPQSTSTTVPCGSEPARESGVSAASDAGCAGVFASRLALTLVVCRARNQLQQQSPVGASLLAKAVGQSPAMQDVPASSQAGSLPHWLCVEPTINFNNSSLWERACSRKRWVKRQRCRMCRRLREQARSHRDLHCFQKKAPRPEWGAGQRIGWLRPTKGAL